MNTWRFSRVASEPLESRSLLAASPIDPSFGGADGVDFTVPLPGTWTPGTNLAIQRNDRLLVAGTLSNGTTRNLTVSRLTPAGNLDRTFGNKGTILAPGDPVGPLVAANPRGGVVLGFAEKWAFRRYDAKGKPITKGFKFAAARFEGNEVADVMLVQADGKVLTIGRTHNSTGVSRNMLVLTRHLHDGRLDRSFGGDGHVYTGIALGPHETIGPDEVALDRQGRILISTGTGLLRLLRNGRRDAAFAGDGDIDAWGAFTIDDNGRIFAGQGHSLERFLPDGSPDPAFGVDGESRIGDGRLHVAPDGGIVAAGYPLDEGTTPGVQRVDADGFLGATVHVPAHYSDLPGDSVMQRDGRVILAIRRGDGSLSLLRFTNPLPQTSPVSGPHRDADDVDTGGPNVSYRDNDRAGGNPGYGLTQVDLDGPVLTRTEPGEWVEYSFDSTGGTYDLTLTVASAGPGGTFHVEFDGRDLTGSISIPDTGGDRTFQPLTRQFDLPKGNATLRLVMDAAGPSGFVGNFREIAIRRGIDRSFGQDGKVDLPPGLVLPRPDGTIAFLKLDGGLAILSEDGRALADHAPAADWTATVFATLQPDGKILAITRDGGPAARNDMWRSLMNPANAYGHFLNHYPETAQFHVRRFNADGSPDASFGDAGVVAAPAGVRRLALLPGGKILAGDPLVRYLPDGRADPTFTPPTPPPVPDGGTPAALVGADALGRVYTIAYRFGPDRRASLFEEPYAKVPLIADVRRLLPDGSPDPTYGAGGLVTVTFPEDDDDDPTFFDPQVLPDGTFVAGAVVNNKNDTHGAYYSGLLVIPRDGLVDPTFGVTRSGYFGGRHLAVLPDGTAALGGYQPVDNYPGGPFQPQLPGVFGIGPAVHLREFAGDDAVVEDLALEPDGHLLVSTTAGLFRYHGPPIHAD